MVTVIGVRFKKAGKIYYFSPGDLDIKKDTYVIVETARGIEFGECVVEPKQIEEDDIVSPLKNVLRIASEEDIKKHNENKAKEKEAFSICIDKIEQHDLKMKLIDVEYTFDNNKVIFYFTADGRVDFRELVKDLASIFRTRIELRQIGVRDEAKMIGGLGPCGRAMCCSTFLGDFAPVSIKMAKEQNLSLNPTKISGICGRLMCCLNYEQNTYEDIRRILPKVQSIVDTPYGKGEVLSNSVVEESIKVKIKSKDGEDMIEKVSIKDVKLISGSYEGNINEDEINKKDVEINDIQDKDSVDKLFKE
ncbi:stage 0 sporulation protein [Clostridium tyrobutyricum]|jgi:cell fate regulator YaaT (PSP1 superfamily)|uniref:Signal peptidase-like protein n=1 Tax=Clostridium tyrobutyricum DIVETGP TaxID=1408889 RepID=W6N524_CLOTY|nr:stage 0 sporulation family protein [Clostridium tyrobutyricum]AND83326.1 signal peptidase II [Clostridium tyrobutyricum]ANP68132.1 stage 0 sporulation protein [Clostridium tyrobutyricum]MBR9649319.1 stage 0 sporulation family protein [Clostridium tyrobutyricum]MBV4416363.1 stage 0 sporulation family protein [Clostridium tyrobutyricum]MBV4423328.1 stage 0 sporulation family protein [Clostridium tyrobutyricum]